MKNKVILRKLVAVGVFAGFFMILGCKTKMIDHVSVKPSANLEVVRISLVFGEKIQPDFSGAFAVKDYGYIFVSPYTPAQRFEVGFDINTTIVNDQDYATFTPTDVLPNGVPIGIEYPVVEIKSERPVSPSFDLYGYVDVIHTQWIGVAAVFKFMSDDHFPEGLSISQDFLKNDLGKPGIIASVFGPTLNLDGTLKRPGGIAMFANIRQLLRDGVLKPETTVVGAQ